MAIRKFDLTNEEWNKISTEFVQENKKGRPFLDLRNTLNAIIWILKTNAPWRDLPKRYGNPNTIFRIYKKWNAEGKLKILKSVGIDVEKNFGGNEQ